MGIKHGPIRFTVKMVKTQAHAACVAISAVSSVCVFEAHSRMPSSKFDTVPHADTSFEKLALPLLASLYSHACWLSRDAAEAEDLVQETLLKSLRAFASFQAGSNFKAWIFRILRNTFLTSRTGIATSRTVFLEDHPDLLETTDLRPTVEDQLIGLVDQAALYAALDQLPAPLREILLLSDVEELKYKEIAQVLEVPIGTVMSRLARARQALSQRLRTTLGESL
jgi:RNA polymerase sigma-70 factor (ECF subfamily)